VVRLLEQYNVALSAVIYRWWAVFGKRSFSVQCAGASPRIRGYGCERGRKRLELQKGRSKEGDVDAAGENQGKAAGHKSAFGTAGFSEHDLHRMMHMCGLD
jgi:hypothetical protein